MIHYSPQTWPRRARCEAVIPNQGDAISSEFSTVTCPECRELGVPPIKYRDVSRVEWLAKFGEGHYGELDWIALGVLTWGVGILPMIATKKICRVIMRSRNA